MATKPAAVVRSPRPDLGDPRWFPFSLGETLFQVVRCMVNQMPAEQRVAFKQGVVDAVLMDMDVPPAPTQPAARRKGRRS